MIKSWLLLGAIYIAVSLLTSTIWIIKGKIKKEELDFAEIFGLSFGTPVILAIGSWYLWIPILDSFSYPNSCRNVEYSAPVTAKPIVEESSSSSRYKRVVEVESEAILGEKRTCLSFLFGDNRETIIREATPTKYIIRTVDNPNYVEPKPVYIAPPAPQKGRSCPITTCCDGTCSSSVGRGTCSWHGGVWGY